MSNVKDDPGNETGGSERLACTSGYNAFHYEFNK
jgi:hypothetical protein